MKFKILTFLLLSFAIFNSKVQATGVIAYVTNSDDDTVSAIDAGTNTVVATYNVGNTPRGIVIHPDDGDLYVANYADGTVSVIDSETQAVSATITVGTNPYKLGIMPDGSKVFVANYGSNNVSVIQTSTNTVTATISVGTNPTTPTVNDEGTSLFVTNYGSNNITSINASTHAVNNTVAAGTNPHDTIFNLAGTKAYLTNFGSDNLSIFTFSPPGGTTLSVGDGPTDIEKHPEDALGYVSNQNADTVSIINLDTNAVSTTVSVGDAPIGIGVDPNGEFIYVVNSGSDTVSRINTSTNTVTSTINVGNNPFGITMGESAVSMSTSASSLTFDSQTVNTTSTAQTITLTNAGGPSILFTSITASGDFAQSNNCGSSLSTGNSCTISVTFTPTTTGSRSGGVTIVSNSDTSPTATVTLTGTGAAASGTGSDTGEDDSCTPDLSVDITLPEGSISVGSDATFELTITNESDDCASENTSLGLTLSDNLVFRNSLNTTLALVKFATAVSCSGTQDVDCDLGTIDSDESITLEVVTRVVGPGEISLEATVGDDATAEIDNSDATSSNEDNRSVTGESAFGCALNESKLNEPLSKGILILFLPLIALAFRLTPQKIKKTFFLFLIGCLFISNAHAVSDRFSIVPSISMQEGDGFYSISSDTLYKNQWRFSSIQDYGYRPLEYTVPGNAALGIVDQLLVQQLGAAYGITDHLTVELGVPVVWINDFTVPGTINNSNKLGLGDVGLQARVLIVDRGEYSFNLAAVAFGTLPTGAETYFTGDNTVTGGAKIVLDKKLGNHFNLILNAGMRFRDEVVFQDYSTSRQFLANLAAKIHFPNKIVGVVELDSKTDATNAYISKVSSPMEVIVGVARPFESIGLDFKLGTGLSVIRGAGTPLFHTFFGVNKNFGGPSSKKEETKK